MKSKVWSFASHSLGELITEFHNWWSEPQSMKSNLNPQEEKITTINTDIQPFHQNKYGKRITYKAAAKELSMFQYYSKWNGICDEGSQTLHTLQSSPNIKQLIKRSKRVITRRKLL